MQAKNGASAGKETNMPRVEPFHSVLQPVHHDNSRCTEGNNIEPQYLRKGTGGKPLCQHCQRLDAQGQ
jgi:hypothetical protein